MMRKVLMFIVCLILGGFAGAGFAYYQNSSSEIEAEHINIPTGFPSTRKLSNGQRVRVYES